MGQQLDCCTSRDVALQEAGAELVAGAGEDDLFYDCRSDCEDAQEASMIATASASDGGHLSTEGTEVSDSPQAAQGLPSRQKSSRQRPAALAKRAVVAEAEARALAQLERLLSDAPETPIAPHGKESHHKRLLRFLRGEKLDPVSTHRRLLAHAAWWRDHGMDCFGAEAELDESGTLFCCGEDLQGRPTLIARPCMHHSASHEQSVQTARRCLYTVQRCVERYPPGVASHTVIYDCRGLDPRKNLDLTFMKEIIPALGSHFPERLHRVIVINGHWTMTGFWAAVSVLLHAETKEKISLHGKDFEKVLLPLLGPDHPYLRYAQQVRDLPAKEAAAVPLPRRTPYVARWQESLEADEDLDISAWAGGCSDSDGGLNSPGGLSRQTTAATKLDLDLPSQSPRASAV